MEAHHSPTPRWAAGVALLGVAAIHLTLVPAHLREAPYAGVLFIGLSVAALVVAVLLIQLESRLVWLAAVMLATAAGTSYLVSRSAGLPALGDDVGDWTNPLGTVSLCLEAAVAAMGLRAGRTRLRATQSDWLRSRELTGRAAGRPSACRWRGVTRTRSSCR